ncbi:hypothetical protein DFH06DRAFT_260259 [Mycena polygramma]|nr:hypothetical protein DFH06DRAFT_260259 [Mycena polygramma]
MLNSLSPSSRRTRGAGISYSHPPTALLPAGARVSCYLLPLFIYFLPREWGSGTKCSFSTTREGGDQPFQDAGEASSPQGSTSWRGNGFFSLRPDGNPLHPTPPAAFPPVSPSAHAAHALLLSWFLDLQAAPFGVHRMALAGKAAGKEVGMWFGPSAAAGALSLPSV